MTKKENSETVVHKVVEYLGFQFTITYQTGCGIVYGASLGLYSFKSIDALLSDGVFASLK